MDNRKNICTVKTCGKCSGAQCALGVAPSSELEKIVCPWQRAIIEIEREEVSND